MKRWSRSSLWAAFAAVLPFLGLSVMVLRAELATRTGPTLRIAIRGYDPRDVLHGHYLMYQFDFDWTEPNTCGDTALEPTAPGIRHGTRQKLRLEPGCCLCLLSLPDSTYPKVTQIACNDPHDRCDGWFRSADVMPPLRYFVPEASAPRLENALTRHQAAVDIVASKQGDLIVRSLLLDGRPWRAVIGD